MISDPRTTPDSALARFLFAFAVALSAHYMAFFMQLRPALYFALIFLSPLTLLLDRLIPAERFIWTSAHFPKSAIGGTRPVQEGVSK